MRGVKDARDVLGLVLCLYGLAAIVGHCTGCTPAQQLNVEHAAAVAQYDAALVECKREGKAAKSLEVYIACENRVSRAYCQSSKALQQEWPKCKELLP